MTSVLSLINIPVFIASLIVGLVFVYISNPQQEKIGVYPTPSNAGRIIYADKAGLCYAYEPEPVKCPETGSKRIPIQE
jgi:hypothetical protein